VTSSISIVGLGILKHSFAVIPSISKELPILISFIPVELVKKVVTMCYGSST
jgi:hypothetical protein